ncbi:alpha/beta hydrolase [Aquimarina mytili]|uniref:Tetratricopeptide repeat protein n=1 Tax=Aquimarina mytili TaxID=874423 RepID=A0A936ZS50_9FLAO|nr:alpha/beta hydrolase-fold protein [Aquimarina mytili]MBL0684422.1 tetratricopeptide repeat protein [Aquimarina mytili]
MKPCTLLWACFIVLLSIKTHAQTKSTPLAYIDQHTLSSNALQQDVALNVYLPDTYNKASDLHTYPLIILLENEFFYQVTGMVKHLSSVSSMPEAIVVSFPNSFEKFYAPKVYTNKSSFWSKSWKQMPFDGDPDVFTKFLKEELFVYLSKHYRTADYRMVIGTSLTATFAMHAFCKTPDLFQAHVAIAAGNILAMGYTPDTTFIEAISESIKANPNRKANLYIACADADIISDPEIGNNAKKLKKQLSALRSENSKLKAETFVNESHYGVVLPAFISAMETFFPKEKWNPDYSVFEKSTQNTLANIDAYYQNLSQEYGYTILPVAERWNSGNSLQAIANRLLRQKRFTESIDVYRRLAAYRPKSPEALSILASALEANNNFKEALAIQQKALKVAKQFDSDHMTHYEEHMAYIESKLAELKDD